MILLPTHTADIPRDWTPVADDGIDFLVAVAGPGVIEVAFTATKSAPTSETISGYEVSRLNREKLARPEVPFGYVWARAQPGGMLPFVRVVLTTWSLVAYYLILDIDGYLLVDADGAEIQIPV
ncbi:MAG: hypothetical protein EOM21_20845 [Gammaproteobacteria bacterium]|nr:hypothetical protein [Gammaproteobacteria bacterium]